MGYRRIDFAERMDIFRFLYVERLKPAMIGGLLGRSPSSITREIAKGTENGMYSPLLAECLHLDARRRQLAAPMSAIKDKRRSMEADKIKTRIPLVT